MKGVLVRFVTIGICLFAISRATLANVIYDVSVYYEDQYTYSFSMEFTNGSGLKDWNDLVGGDFTGEVFEGPNGPWTLQFDAQTGSLDFDADNMVLAQFAANDTFVSPDGAFYTIGIESGHFETLTIGGDTGFTVSQLYQVITLRPPAAVPAAPTAALILAGLVAWRLRTGAASASREMGGRVGA